MAKSKTETRNGRHKEGNVLMGAVVTPLKKAITIVTSAVFASNGEPMTQTDIIWKGIENLAIQAGVLTKDGKVAKEFADAVALAEASVIASNKSNRGTRGGANK
jgi:hypothetical protein